MRSNGLQLNTAKTEILWSTTGCRSHHLPQSLLRVGTDDVITVAVVRDLGIYIDSDVSMRSHVTSRRPSLPASPYCVSCEVFAGPLPSLFSSRYSDVSCSDAARLRKCNSRRHSAVSAEATSVGDELCCSAGVLIVAVRPCQPTPPPTALVEGKGAN